MTALCPTEASKAAVSYVRNTSTAAVRSANSNRFATALSMGQIDSHQRCAHRLSVMSLVARREPLSYARHDASSRMRILRRVLSNFRARGKSPSRKAVIDRWPLLCCTLIF